ncbi:hypothetical protein Tco_0694832 [Tanacetum coccineum]
MIVLFIIPLDHGYDILDELDRGSTCGIRASWLSIYDLQGVVLLSMMLLIRSTGRQHVPGCMSVTAGSSRFVLTLQTVSIGCVTFLLVVMLVEESADQRQFCNKTATTNVSLIAREEGLHSISDSFATTQQQSVTALVTDLRQKYGH